MEFYTICFAFFPIIMFTKNERAKLFLTFGLIVTAVAITIAFIQTNEPLAVMTPEMLDRAYNVTFITITVIVLGLVGYYHSSSVTARVNLDDQNRRIEEILANVLPHLIAERLKESDTVIAESHGEASVLFADLVGFSELSKRLSPKHVVDILNAIFTRMDELADEYGVEKIKTIGDCYMAASGVLSATEGQVEAIANFALALPDVVREVAEQTNYPLDVRIGISTGAVISGVIGTNKYSFDLWGDTVNLANAMEEAGVKGCIQVSEATYWRLQPTHELERRGEIDIKGKFKETAYFLRGRKPDSAGAGTHGEPTPDASVRPTEESIH
jgi:class 3 adenylate cyclase